MCFSPEDRPPLPPVGGDAVDGHDVILTSADGTSVPAHAARASARGGPGIVIVPDVRGLHPYYEELARRFAETGVHAVAFDFYARTAGSEKRDESFEPQPHVLGLQPHRVDEDVAAAAAYLRSGDGGEPDRMYTIGFCLGGRISLLQAASGLGLDGVIGFYPWPTGDHRSGLPAPSDEAPRFGCKVLALYGGDDAGIPAEARATFDRALDEAGVEHRSVTYPGAPHSFFDRKATDFADAYADAWRQVLDFVGVASA